MNKGKKKNLSIPLFTDCRSYPFTIFGKNKEKLHSKNASTQIIRKIKARIN